MFVDRIAPKKYFTSKDKEDLGHGWKISPNFLLEQAHYSTQRHIITLQKYLTP